METPEEIIEKITNYDSIDHYVINHKPLSLEKNKFFGGNYHLIDERGKPFLVQHYLKLCEFTKEEIVKALKENNNHIEKAFHDLIKLGKERIKEVAIKVEINKLKAIEQRKLIREEAEKRLYGKVEENKRAAISEKDKEIIFSKFNNECTICNRKEGLHIHHKDHNPSNNRMDNLIVLCGVCHKKIHMKVR